MGGSRDYMGKFCLAIAKEGSYLAGMKLFAKHNLCLEFIALPGSQQNEADFHRG